MNKEFKVTKEKILAMAEGCPEAKTTLKKGFPEAFKDGWKKVTKEITMNYSWDISQEGGFCFNYQGTILFWGTIIKRDEKSNSLGLDVKLEKGEIYIKKR